MSNVGCVYFGTCSPAHVTLASQVLKELLGTVLLIFASAASFFRVIDPNARTLSYGNLDLRLDALCSR
jgi:hypothetical protein